MRSYPAGPGSVSGIAGGGEVPGGGSLMVAVRLEDVASPLRNGRVLEEGDRSALVIGGTERIRTGGAVMFLKVVAVAPAQVRRDGRVQAQGSPVHHATLGPLEDWLGEQAGPGVIDGIAERAVLREQYVKGERERLLARAFMIRAVVLMTLMPDADVREVLIALAGDLALVPWARAWAPAFGAGVRGLAERARAGATGGTAGHRAAGLVAGARGPGLARGHHRQEQAAEGVVAGRDADPGAGHAREPGRVRLGRDRG